MDAPLRRVKAALTGLSRPLSVDEAGDRKLARKLPKAKGGIKKATRRGSR